LEASQKSDMVYIKLFDFCPHYLNQTLNPYKQVRASARVFEKN